MQLGEEAGLELLYARYGGLIFTLALRIVGDPELAREVLHSKLPITLVPLDAMRKIVFSPSDLLELPSPECRVSKFLRQIVPFGIRACSNLYGIEGFPLKDVMGIVAQVLPQAVSTPRSAKPSKWPTTEGFRKLRSPASWARRWERSRAGRARRWIGYGPCSGRSSSHNGEASEGRD